MFALDLFNTDHERRLAEGAVDQLEQRRIDDLAMKMDDLVARARQANTPDAKAALMKEFQKCKSERDSYYKIRNETMGYGTLVGEEGVTRTAAGLKHQAKPGTYGGYEPEADPLARLDKHAVNRADKALGVKFDREKKYQGGLDVDEAGIPGNVPAEKIPGKEDLLKGKGRQTYESQKKNSDEIDEGRMGEIDAMRQDVERMNDRQFYTAYGMSKAAFQQKYRTLLKPVLDEDRLSVGDPVVVTGPNEFEGKTGEIDEFSPSGTFVIVNLYNHGKHSMHLSDIAYNEYADQEQDEEDDWYDDEVDEGFQDFNKIEPYAVCLAGKPVKKFDYYEDARRFHDNWKKKLYREGNQAKADKITLLPLNLDEEGKGTPVPAKEFARGVLKDLKKVNVKEAEGSWIVYDPETKQIKKRFKTHTAGKSYAKVHNLGFASSEYYFDTVKEKAVDEGIVASGPSQPLDDRAVRKLVWDTMKINADTGDQAIQRALSVLAKKPQSRMVQDLQDKFQNLADRLSQGVAEAETDYSKRRQRERDVDAGKPVAKQRQSKMTDYQKKRAQDKRDMELGESQDTSGVERAILNRIMVAHTDLLMKFGPEKVMQAAEEVAYNVGDVDEIGTSDVSAYVAQVKQILGVPEEVNEKWSQKYKSSINCSNPKGFSQRAHCDSKKK